MATAVEKKQADEKAEAAQKAADAKSENGQSDSPGTTDDSGQPERTAQGKPPVVGVEPGGGILEDGTGDFAPDHQDLPEEGEIFDDGKQIVKVTADGDRVAVYVGIDGENAVSPQNPLRKTTIR